MRKSDMTSKTDDDCFEQTRLHAFIRVKCALRKMCASGEMCYFLSPSRLRWFTI